MPRTRNVTRAQWDAANASNSITTGDHNRGGESEKENEERPATRATRSQTRTGNYGNRVLGSTTLRISTMSKGSDNTVSANTTKVKGKGRATAPPPKRKKLPLQDITSQFLPAPEAANRGDENEPEHAIFQQAEQMVDLVSPLPLAQNLGGGDILGPANGMSHPAPTYLDSPLPPSSPPSAITSSPQYPKILQKSNPSWLSSEHNLWNQFDEGRPAQGSPSVISSSSDPFGFVALERKLKVERRAAVPSPLKRHHQEDESDEELGLFLVADTSSPRLVRRLKRPSYQGDSPFPPAISERPIYATPPTPHKDKKKRPRLSHEGDRIFSPCSSSLPSTPSPSKVPVQKQARRKDTMNSNVKGNQEVEGVLGRTRNRTALGIVESEPSATSKVTEAPLELGKSLDDDGETGEEQADPKRAKVAMSKKKPKKPRSVGTKKSKKEKNDVVEYEEVCSLPD